MIKKTGSKKWLGPIFTKTKNGILLTIARPTVLAFYADSKYIKLFQFIVTHPQLKIWENLLSFWKKGEHPQKCERSYWKSLNKKIISENSTIEVSSSNLQNVEFRIFFFSEETSSMHVYLFCFSQGWLYQSECPR